MNFTAAMKIPNFRGLLASLLRLHRGLVPDCTDKSVHFRLNLLYENPKVQVVVLVVIIAVVVVICCCVV